MSQRQGFETHMLLAYGFLPVQGELQDVKGQLQNEQAEKQSLAHRIAELEAKLKSQPAGNTGAISLAVNEFATLCLCSRG